MQKHIIFDFDGTLTKSRDNIWRKIYETLGYDTSKGSKYKQDLHDFLDGKLSYNNWCKINANDFRSKGLNKDIIDKLMSGIVLHDDTIDTIKALHSLGFKVHVVSGNIVYVIESVLSDIKDYIMAIKGNEFIFDETNNFLDIVPTKYDCEGKATYIQEIISNEGVDPKDIYFVGNGINDEWVSMTGCNTICINADETDSTNRKIWHREIKTLSELIDLVK